MHVNSTTIEIKICKSNCADAGLGSRLAPCDGGVARWDPDPDYVHTDRHFFVCLIWLPYLFADIFSPGFARTHIACALRRWRWKNMDFLATVMLCGFLCVCLFWFFYPGPHLKSSHRVRTIAVKTAFCVSAACTSV